MALTEDLDAFLDIEDFAIAATLQGGGDGAVKVIFDAAYLQQLGVMVGTNPVALAKATDVVATDVGKTLTINGTAYTVRGREPQDDDAFVLLQLSAP